MNLLEWLEQIQSLHVTDMDLSLERVSEVARRLNLLSPAGVVIAVGGTNGKGSCVAGLEAIYLAQGYRVGAFTSPILYRHNEYIRLQGVEASDELFCAAFEKIDAARGEITLTPFEFNALAAFELFQMSQLDVWILEVGLGGRFDAVNVLNADIALITSIGIDHVEWLGDTREKIAYEKAGILRKNKLAVCGELDPPHTLLDYAIEIGAHLYCQSKQFGFEKKAGSWDWWSQTKQIENLPLPSLLIANMSTVLMAVELLQDKLPVQEAVIREVLAKITLPGRIQVVPGDITHIFDVSHNPASVELFADWLREHPCAGKTRAVFSMLADKDILTTILQIKELVDEWHTASLGGKRGASLARLMDCFQAAGVGGVLTYESVELAYQAALARCEMGDRVIVFGSFHTVGLVRVA